MRLKGKAAAPFFRFIRLIYLKLFRINDTPDRIAIGLGLGVFFGVMPGMGPLIALTFAVIFKVNRAAAFLGGLLTNTWISVPILLVAAKVGSALTGARYEYIHDQWGLLLKNFSFSALFKVSVDKILLPVLTGYVIISLATAVSTYAIALTVLRYRKKVRSPRPTGKRKG